MSKPRPTTRTYETSEMNSENAKRFYEKSEAETELAILPGENSLEFELLRTKLAEELAPDGPLEEDAVCTMAKCIWRKRRWQRFLEARSIAARFDPDHGAYDDKLTLSAFFQVVKDLKDEEQLMRMVGRHGGHLAEYLLRKLPRRTFKTTKGWIKAITVETMKLLAQTLGPTPDEVLISQSAAFLTDEIFTRELDFEKRIDAELKQACKRYFEIKAAKRQIRFREIQRFERHHAIKLIKVGR